MKKIIEVIISIGVALSLSITNLSAENKNPFVGYGAKIEVRLASVDTSNPYRRVVIIEVKGYSKNANNTWIYVGSQNKAITINSPGAMR